MNLHRLMADGAAAVRAIEKLDLAMNIQVRDWSAYIDQATAYAGQHVADLEET